MLEVGSAVVVVVVVGGTSVGRGSKTYRVVVLLLACDHVVYGGSNTPLCFLSFLQPSGMTQALTDSPGPAAVAAALVSGLPVVLTALRVALMVLRGRAAADAASRASVAVLIFILICCVLDLLTI